MEFIADLHIHSKYARATSAQMELANIDAMAAKKGIKIISTGDFTHPVWFKNLKTNLEEAERGLYRVKGSSTQTRFVLGVEIATVHSAQTKRESKVRKVHHVVLAPGLEEAAQINDELGKRCDLSIDGRPIVGISPAELVEIVKGVSAEAVVFPAHAWTPWYGVFGSVSGYDSMKEAYDDQERNIPALETGLSSDPPMNWRVSALDKYALVSTSDAHSLQKIGREATVFEIEEEKLSFKAIASAIACKSIKYTIEFYPEEGKYHYDGHRKCGVSLSPEESEKYNNICPVCGKPLTLGVLHRVCDMADRPAGYLPKGSAPFVHAVPLIEVISKTMGKAEAAEAVQREYSLLVSKFGSEFNVLLNASIDEISRIDAGVARAIKSIRNDKVYVEPGYDGVFGIVKLTESNGREQHAGSSMAQKTIGDFKSEKHV
ncbi:MAG: endonuclease Q family protein [Candidatus Micrarchaeia archaeon]